MALVCWVGTRSYLGPKNRSAAVMMFMGDDQSEIAILAPKHGCRDYIAKDYLSLDSFSPCFDQCAAKIAFFYRN